jgi:hypothetical protein
MRVHQVHYVPGKTPLVGWIKGYMVPELLDIEVCQVSTWPGCISQIQTISCISVFSWNLCISLQELLEQRPAEYGGMKTYLKKTYDRVDRLKKADAEKARAEQEVGALLNHIHFTKCIFTSFLFPGSDDLVREPSPTLSKSNLWPEVKFSRFSSIILVVP